MAIRSLAFFERPLTVLQVLHLVLLPVAHCTPVALHLVLCLKARAFGYHLGLSGVVLILLEQL
jgi:hypothetical protein